MSTALSAEVLARTLLLQASREWDPSGHIMAEIGDYAALHALVVNPVSGGAEANVAVDVSETRDQPVVAVASEKRLDERYVPAVTIPLLGSRDPPLYKGAVGQHQTPHPDLAPE